MLSPYLRVLRRPGAARFSAAGAFARLQMSMTGVGAVLLLSAVRDSYGLAGGVAATYAIAVSLLSPHILRMIDALGQRRVVPRQLAVHVPAMACMIAVAVLTELTWPIFVLAVIAGGAQPSIGSLVRARWSAMLSGTSGLRVAFAWESLIDEVVFILGPPLATILALQLFPSAALVFATLFLTVGSLALVAQIRTQPQPHPVSRSQVGKPAILLPGVAGIFGVMVMLGGVFGALEVTTVAVTKAQGHPGAAGVLLAVYSLGSLLSGLVFGALKLRAGLLRQFAVALVALAFVSAPMAFLGPLWLVGAGLFVAGLAVAPSLISGMSMIEHIVPAARMSESMGWTTSGIGLGLAVSMPLAGLISDHTAPARAYLVLSGCAVGAMLIGLAVAPSLRRALAAADQTGVAATAFAEHEASADPAMPVPMAPSS